MNLEIVKRFYCSLNVSYTVKARIYDESFFLKRAFCGREKKPPENYKISDLYSLPNIVRVVNREE